MHICASLSYDYFIPETLSYDASLR